MFSDGIFSDIFAAEGGSSRRNPDRVSAGQWGGVCVRGRVVSFLCEKRGRLCKVTWLVCYNSSRNKAVRLMVSYEQAVCLIQV